MVSAPFDSPAVLCRLLDAERGGTVRVGPEALTTFLQFSRISPASSRHKLSATVAEFVPDPDERRWIEPRARTRSGSRPRHRAEGQRP